MRRLSSPPKTLLVFPPSTVYVGDPTVPIVTIPLGLAYLAAYLEKNDFPVKILDTIAEGKKTEKKKNNSICYGLNDKEIIKEIKKYSPDVVGITCLYTAYAGDAHRVASLVKKINKKILVIFGGAHATIFPELTLKDKNIDIVVMGEGEETLLEIVKALSKKKSLTKIAGTVTRKNNKIVINKPRKFIEELDEIPFPARHLLPMRKYLKMPDYSYTMRPPSAPMITSRGCPGHCVYCSIHSIWGHSWRGRNPKRVVDEMEMLKNEYGAGEIDFFDDSMGANKKRLEEICDEIIKRKLDIRWSPPNGIAHWTLDEKLLEKMKKAGCYRITFGIESGNLETRRFIGKPYDLSQAKKMIKHANKIGMWTICTNIIGFPYETRQQIQDTIDFAFNSDTDLAIFYLLCPHPGTHVYELFKKENLANFDYIFTPNKRLKAEDFVEIGRALSGRGVKTKYFSQEELQKIVSDAYKSFLARRFLSFLNPSRILRKIHSWEDFTYVLKISFKFLEISVREATSKTFGSQMLRRDME